MKRSRQSVTYWRISVRACKSVGKINKLNLFLAHENYKGLVFTHRYVVIQVVTEGPSLFVSMNILSSRRPFEDRQRTDQDIATTRPQKQNARLDVQRCISNKKACVWLRTEGNPYVCSSPAEMFVGLQSVSCREKDSKNLHLCYDGDPQKYHQDLIFQNKHLFLLSFIYFSVKCNLCQINGKKKKLFKFSHMHEFFQGQKSLEMITHHVWTTVANIRRVSDTTPPPTARMMTMA